MYLGIFVGGRSSRMGGAPKGLLEVEPGGETIVSRWLGLSSALHLTPAFVGEAARYAALYPDVRCIADSPVGVGPLGGLMALLGTAGAEAALAVACDMPHVSPSLLARLCSESPEAVVLAPRGPSGRWEPLCARYASPIVRPALDHLLASGVRSFQGLLAHVATRELPIADSDWAQMVDWDTFDDVARGPGRPAT